MSCANNVYADVYGENATFLPWNPGHTPQCSRCIQLENDTFTTVVTAPCTAPEGAICQLLPPYNEPGQTTCPPSVPGVTAFWQTGNSCNYVAGGSKSPIYGRHFCQTKLGGDLCMPVLLTDLNDWIQHTPISAGVYVGLRTNHTSTMVVNSYNWLDGTPFSAQPSAGLTQWQSGTPTSIGCGYYCNGSSGIVPHACTCSHSFCCRVLLDSTGPPSPANHDHTYRAYQRAIILGDDVTTATNGSLSDCKSLCDSNMTCRAIIYSDSGVCSLKRNNSFQSTLQLSASADFYEQIDSALASWEYKGCFADQHQVRDLPYMYNMSLSATVIGCIQHCADKAYSFAGLQAGQLCMCGRSYGHYGSKPNAECVTSCPANSTEYCGGTLRNAVFATNAPTLRGRLSTKNGHRLVNHVSRTVISQDPLACARECVVDNVCRSFNYSPSHRQCELNDVSHLEAVVNESISAPDWLYGFDTVQE